MIRIALVLTTLGLLAACGADGLPIAPSASIGTGTSGVTFGGTIATGVAVNGTGG